MNTQPIPPASTIFGNTGVLVTLDEGLIGCERWKRFVLDTVPEAAPLLLLRSLDEPEVSFVVGDPRSILSGYKLQPTEADLAALGRPAVDELASVVIFNAGEQEGVTKATANLLGPIAINLANGAARQIIQPEYSAQHPVGE